MELAEACKLIVGPAGSQVSPLALFLARTRAREISERERERYMHNHSCMYMSISTVLHRGMGTPLMGTILEFASVPPRKMGTLLLGSWWP